MGDLKFDELAKLKLHGLSNIIASYQKFAKLFPNSAENSDNSWFCQPLFNNSNIKTKIPNRRGTGWKIKSLNPEYLNLPKNLTLNLNEVYDSGRQLTHEAMENLMKVNGNMNFNLEENTRIRIYSLLKYVLGNGSHYDGIKKTLWRHCTSDEPKTTKIFIQ